MDFGDSSAESEFRRRLREWLKVNNPGLPISSTDDDYWAGAADWHRTLFDAGFFALSWPVDIGGQGLPPVYEVIVDEELAAAGAPPRPSLGYLVQGLLEHGGDEIQRRFLPGIVNGRDRWCQGFSEPDAGSDLASLRTRAERTGDDYVITGHKVWTSYSDEADWCLVLARTDPTVARHRGISAFAVPMHQPGIEQRPLRMINGVTKEFGEVLFDGARTAVGNMIGEPGEGWPLAMTVVSHEREPGELGYVARYSKVVNDLVGRVRSHPEDYRAEQRTRPRVGHRGGRDAAPARPPSTVRAARRDLPRSGRLGGQVTDDVGRADRGPRRCVCRGYRSRGRGERVVEHLPVQPSPERHGRHIADPAKPRGPSHSGIARFVTHRASSPRKHHSAFGRPVLLSVRLPIGG